MQFPPPLYKKLSPGIRELIELPLFLVFLLGGLAIGLMAIGYFLAWFSYPTRLFILGLAIGILGTWAFRARLPKQ